MFAMKTNFSDDNTLSIYMCSLVVSCVKFLFFSALCFVMGVPVVKVAAAAIEYFVYSD